MNKKDIIMKINLQLYLIYYINYNYKPHLIFLIILVLQQIYFARPHKTEN